MKVLKTSLKFLALFTSLKIREILKALMIVVAPPIEKPEIKAKNTETIEPTTTIKSKIFQLSLKYYFPNPHILIAASSPNIPANI